MLLKSCGALPWVILSCLASYKTSKGVSQRVVFGIPEAPRWSPEEFGRSTGAVSIFSQMLALGSNPQVPPAVKLASHLKEGDFPQEDPRC